MHIRISMFQNKTEWHRIARASAVRSCCRASTHLYTSTPTFARNCLRTPRHIFAEMRPDPTDSKDELEAAFKRIAEYLEQHADRIFGRDKLVPCLAHRGKQCPAAWADIPMDGARRPLTVSCAGTVCLPWSQFSNHQGLAHMTTESWLVWSIEQRKLQLDAVFHEHSEMVPLEVFCVAMGEGYVIISLAKQ